MTDLQLKRLYEAEASYLPTSILVDTINDIRHKRESGVGITEDDYWESRAARLELARRKANELEALDD